MLLVDLMIILFHLKLDQFYCIWVMNQLKVIYFFVHINMSYYYQRNYYDSKEITKLNINYLYGIKMNE